jgi:hypothetical protein
VWLPVDAKFPTDDYRRLIHGQKSADPVAGDEATKMLTNQIRASAENFHEKYLCPPVTTDFGIMYLPTEGLYAEVARRPELIEGIQRDFRVVVAGQTTFAALLNSLRMGFRTLAIQERSSEVWKLLGAVKTQFGKFGDVLEVIIRAKEGGARSIPSTFPPLAFGGEVETVLALLIHDRRHPMESGAGGCVNEGCDAFVADRERVISHNCGMNSGCGSSEKRPSNLPAPDSRSGGSVRDAAAGRSPSGRVTKASAFGAVGGTQKPQSTCSKPRLQALD